MTTIAVLGNDGVGKRSLVDRLVTGNFSNNMEQNKMYLIDYTVDYLENDNNTYNYKFNIIINPVDFKSVTKCFIVTDGTQTEDQITKWISIAQKNNISASNTVIIQNKTDLGIKSKIRSPKDVQKIVFSVKKCYGISELYGFLGIDKC